jgi:lysozyme family protein
MMRIILVYFTLCPLIGIIGIDPMPIFDHSPPRITVECEPQTPTSDTFQIAFDALIKHEGGFVICKRRGETKFGITERTYPHLNIRELTIEDARYIYHKDWWVKNSYNQIPYASLATRIFDFSVHAGADRSHSILQLALNNMGHPVTIDGKIGEETLRAIRHSDPILLVRMFIEAIRKFYYDLAANHPQQSKYLKGWLRRLEGT